jgi:hypothetical protein
MLVMKVPVVDQSRQKAEAGEILGAHREPCDVADVTRGGIFRVPIARDLHRVRFRDYGIEDRLVRQMRGKGAVVRGGDQVELSLADRAIQNGRQVFRPNGALGARTLAIERRPNPRCPQSSRR